MNEDTRENITFSATIHRISSSPDGGWRITLESPDTNEGAELMRLTKSPMVFTVTLTAQQME